MVSRMTGLPSAVLVGVCAACAACGVGPAARPIDASPGAAASHQAGVAAQPTGESHAAPSLAGSDAAAAPGSGGSALGRGSRAFGTQTRGDPIRPGLSASGAGPQGAGSATDRVKPEDVARARALVEQGTRLYREGEYDQAEDKLKQAITIHPFMADANLVLAKILLIRASASRDMTLYTNARLMLEMARALDPSSREVEQLLELIQQPMAE